MMHILGVDTSGQSCSAAVIDEKSMLAEVNFDRPESHSKHLMEIIKMALGLAKIEISGVNGFAVTRGPGTFTGLRIGISSVKGFAAACARPVVGVSSLEAIAMQSASINGLVCPMIDARRGEVYTSVYRAEDRGLIKEKEEAVLPPDKAVANINEPCIFVGSGACLYEKIILKRMGNLAEFAWPGHNVIRGSTVARMGLKRIKDSDFDDVSAFVPYYIRKSDAELNRSKGRDEGVEILNAGFDEIEVINE